jgi:hypothetical protein
MEALKVEPVVENIGTRVMKITGWTDNELSELNSMEYREMIDKILEILDVRNLNMGTCWHNGYGVYTAWISGSTVFVEIGNSCD